MIAILGATGYIGRTLARAWGRSNTEGLVLFARRPGLLAAEQWPTNVAIGDLDDFCARDFTMVVNAIGAGDPAQVAKLGSSILEITRAWDDRVITTMAPETRYVFLSSGAVYGTEFSAPAQRGDSIRLPVNALSSVPAYVLAKLYAEGVHRHAAERAILDIRVFGYAEPPIDLGGTSFLANLACSVATGAPFIVSSEEMVRDYAGAMELIDFIEVWVRAGAPNIALDMYTLAPVSKSDLIEEVKKRYGINVEYGRPVTRAPTGLKAFYASENRAASEIGFTPMRSSLEVVLTALDALT